MSIVKRDNINTGFINSQVQPCPRNLMGGGVIPFVNTKSLAFDGMDDTIDCGNISALSNTDSFTVSGWVNFDLIDDFNSLFSMYFSASQRFELYSTTSGSGYLYCLVDGGQCINGSISTYITNGVWHHIAIVYDGTQSGAIGGTVPVPRLKLYIDGADIGWTHQPITVPSSININTSNLNIGHSPWSSYTMSGGIDEVAIWDTALTDIASIWNLGTPTDLSTLSTPPVAWYRMGDSSTYQTPQILMPENLNKDKVSNYSMAFDGVDDSIELGTISHLQNTTEYSISSWFKTPLTVLNQAIYAWFDGADGYLQLLLVSDGSFIVYNYRTSTAYGLTATGIVSADTWYNALVVFDGSGATNSDRLKLYINGVLITLTFTGTIPTQTGTMLIQGMQIGSQQGALLFEGNIDEVSIFDSAISIGDVWDGSGQPIDVSAVSGLANYYKLGEQARYNGTDWLIPNSISSNYSNFSFNFDGVDDYVDCGVVPTLQSTANYSISAWIRVPNLSANNIFIGTYVSGTNTIYMYVTTAGELVFFMNGKQRLSGTSNTISINTWYNVIFVFDGSIPNMSIYLNGSIVNGGVSPSLPTSSGTNTNPFYLGGLGGLTNRGNLDLDEVGFFDYSIDSIQATSIYNLGQPNDLSTLATPPTNWWRLGEDASFSTNWNVPDQIGSNDGTSANMTLADLVGDAPGITGSGTSDNMTIEDREGNAPNSDKNSLSYNMDAADVVLDVP